MSFYSEASLAYVASAGAGKDGKAYSMKPVDGTGDFTFSRGSNLAATRVGPTGLIEKGRENLLLQSNQFDTTWTDVSASVTSGQSGYDGSSDAWLLEKSGASGRILQSISAVSGVYTYSIYAKQGSSNSVLLLLDALADAYAYFDLSAGTILSNSNIIDAYISDAGNGWYRVSVLVNISSFDRIRIYPAQGADTSATSGSIYIQDAQVELGLAATDYIESGASTGKAGLLEDEPRFDYSGGATCPSLLLEPSRTQLVDYSEYIDGLDKAGTPTLSLESETNPSGSAFAYKVTATELGSRVQQTIGTQGNNFVFSGFFKGTGTATRIRFRNNQGEGVFYDIAANGTFTLYTEDIINDNYGVVDYGNGWHRIYFETTTASGTNNYIQVYADVLDGDGSVLVWGLQAEQGSYPTSYIPNHSGGAITRGYDLGSIGDYIGSTITFGPTDNFSIFYDGEVYQTDRMVIGGGDSGLNAGRLWIRDFQIRLDGTTPSASLMADTSVVVDLNTRFKLLVKRNGATIDFFLNGNKLTTTQGDTDATFVINSLFWSFNNVYTAFGRHNQLLVLPTALSDADCITLTT